MTNPRGRPPTTSTRILNHLTTDEWRELPWDHMDRDIASALHRLKQKGLIEAQPRTDRNPKERQRYRKTR